MDIATIGLGKMGGERREVRASPMLRKFFRHAVVPAFVLSVTLAVPAAPAAGPLLIDDFTAGLSAKWERSGSSRPALRSDYRSHRVPRQEAGRKAHGGTPLLPRRS